MKITANRRDDILRRKSEWEADYKRREEAHQKEYNSYLEAEYTSMEPVRKTLEDIFSKYPLLDAKIDVGRGFRRGVQVDIRVNENRKFDENTALSWSYTAYIKDGVPVRETSSWSGMQALTVNQIAELEQSVAVLKELAFLNWDSLLDVKLPNYSDYIKTEDPSYDQNKPNFNRELEEAELEDLIGARKMVKVQPFSGSWYNGPVYIAIVKDSGSQYTIKECPLYYVDRGEASKYFDNSDTHRVKKANIHPVQPLDIIEV